MTMITKTYELDSQQIQYLDEKSRSRSRRIKSIQELECEMAREKKHIDELYINHILEQAAQ